MWILWPSKVSKRPSKFSSEGHDYPKCQPAVGSPDQHAKFDTNQIYGVRENDNVKASSMPANQPASSRKGKNNKQSYPNKPCVSATTSLMLREWQNSPTLICSSWLELVSTTTCNGHFKLSDILHQQQNLYPKHHVSVSKEEVFIFTD